MAQIHTKEKLIGDIILQLTQGSPSDDLQLEESQVAYWIEYTLHDLIRKEIVEELSKGNMIPPIYVRRDVALTLTEENITNVDSEHQRMYVDLPEKVLDLPRDAGIVRVLDYDRNLIHKTSVEELEYLRNLRFAKPSLNNVVYYREGAASNRIFIEGFNTADIDFNPIMVSYVPRQDILALADSGEVLISDRLVPILIDLCVQRGKLELYGTQVDQENDGVDNKQVQYHTAIQNPASVRARQAEQQQEEQ